MSNKALGTLQFDQCGRHMTDSLIVKAHMKESYQIINCTECDYKAY